ncbi:MAG TPA: hypothetical protein PKC84_00205 [Paracoccaceae bacterium]|nr:hypothetical protein [Paracoccaceae bacterium]
MRRALSALLLLLAAAAAPPRPAAAGDLLLSAGDLAPAGLPGLAAARLVPPDPAPGLPAVDPAATDAAAVLLRRLAAAGRAAGAAGLVYDNRDRGHSDLPAATLPGLARLRYDAALRAAGLDYGLAGAILLPRAITFGNSSTAVTGGDAPRSLGRLAMTTASGPARAFAAHAGNRIDVYPAHLDHDAADLFPANWPYMVLSQGSSGSDQPFLRAIALTLAAFPPETRARLAREGLVAPAVQMTRRRRLVTVRRRAA